MIKDYLIKNAKYIHFIGIGGISMSGLATLMMKMKIKVSGSDLVETHITRGLRKKGAKVFIGHSESNIKSQDLVVYSGAIKADNEELVKAKALGIACVERSEFLGYVSKLFKVAIAVGGSHGKTTTSSMLSKCLIDVGLNPCVHLGGEVDFLGGSVRACSGKGLFISEACEYRKSFLYLKRDYAILLNMEADHLDYYKTMENLNNAFLKFANGAEVLVTAYELNELHHFKSGKVVTVSLYNEKADFMIKNLSLLNCGGHCFEVYKRGEFYYNFTINVIGEFNVFNALCVIALCDELGVEKAVIHNALLSFKGARRRFEHLGMLNNAQVIIDYAHHPTEIAKVVAGFRSFFKGELVVLFQPHTYSRTKDLLKGFVRVFSDCAIDTLIILPTYPAREKPEQGLSGKQLQEEIAKAGVRACYYMSFKKAKSYLLDKSLADNVSFLILGAGDVEDFARALVAKC